MLRFKKGSSHSGSSDEATYRMDAQILELPRLELGPDVKHAAALTLPRACLVRLLSRSSGGSYLRARTLIEPRGIPTAPGRS